MEANEETEKLKEEKERLEKELAQKNNMLANVCHDLRTPIGAIVSFAHMLNNTDDMTERAEYIEIINENERLVQRLINDILDMSKIESGTLFINPAPFDIVECLQVAYEMACKQNKNELVRIEFVQPPARTLTVNSDRLRITQVINNLIGNSIRFTNSGYIRIGLTASENNVHISIEDSGRGIPPEMQRNVFDRYVCGESADSFGIGLHICKHLINQMGGSIDYTSEYGKGTKFWFDIPIECGNKVQPAAAPGKEEDKPLLLVAEDDMSSFKLANYLLRDNFRILHAWDGEEAVKMSIDHNPDIILMDINMPRKNGYEAMKQIKQQLPKTPVIAVTAYAMINDSKKIMDAGFDAYLTKPIDVNKFLSLVTNFLKK